MAATRVPRTPRDPRPPTLRAAQAAGFVVGGEPLAVDLADTLITVTDPPTDLLADAARVHHFWAIRPFPIRWRKQRDKTFMTVFN